MILKRSCLCSGWNKASLSLDASEEHDGYSSAEDPLNSDAEEDNGKTLVRKSRCDNWKQSTLGCRLAGLDL